MNGNIFIKGGGDPTLGSARFSDVLTMKKLSELFKKEILKSGLKSINGSIIGDGSYYEYMPIPATWQWEDIGNYYGTGVYGLNFHDNEFTIYFKKSLLINGRPTIAKIVTDIKLNTPNSGRLEHETSWTYTHVLQSMLQLFGSLVILSYNFFIPPL